MRTLTSLGNVFHVVSCSTEDGEKASRTGKEREQKGEASEKARERGREAEDLDSRSSRVGRSGCASGRVCVTEDTRLCLLALERGSEEGQGVRRGG